MTDSQTPDALAVERTGDAPTPALPPSYGRQPGLTGPTDGQLIHVLAERSLSAARRAATLKLPEPHSYGLVTDAGVEIRTVPPAPRDHRLATTAELPDYLADALGFQPSVWVAADAVRVVLNDAVEDRRDERCRCDLPPTPEWSLLQTWSREGFQAAPRDLVKLLRTTLADALTETVKEQIKAIASLKGRNEVHTRAVSGLGRESLGREIEREVTSDLGELPETLKLSVRPFADPALDGRFPVRVHLDVDADTLRFTAVANAADLAEAEAAQLEGIRSRIARAEGEQLADVPAFLGRPDGGA